MASLAVIVVWIKICRTIKLHNNQLVSLSMFENPISSYQLLIITILYYFTISYLQMSIRLLIIYILSYIFYLGISNT